MLEVGARTRGSWLEGDEESEEGWIEGRPRAGGWIGKGDRAGRRRRWMDWIGQDEAGDRTRKEGEGIWNEEEGERWLGGEGSGGDPERVWSGGGGGNGRMGQGA